MSKTKYPTNSEAQKKARKAYNEKRKTLPVYTIQLTEVPTNSIEDFNILANQLGLSKSKAFTEILNYYILNKAF